MIWRVLLFWLLGVSVGIACFVPKPPKGGISTYTQFGYTHDSLGRVSRMSMVQSPIVLPSEPGGGGSPDLAPALRPGGGGPVLTNFIHGYSYDAEGQILEDQRSALPSGGAHSTNLDYAYEYDLAGNRIARQTQSGPPQSETFPAAGGGTTTAAATPVYTSASTYNNVNQLTARSGGSGTVPVFIKGKANEPVSVTVNGTAAQVTVDPASTTGGDLFSLWVGLAQGGNAVAIQATDQGPAGVNVTSKTAEVYVAGASGANKSYSYDNNGNGTGYTSSAGNVTYTWDAEDRLLSVTKGSTTTSFTYDGLSRCVKITTTTSGTVTSTKKFVWSGSERCAETNSSTHVTTQFYPEGEVIGGTAYYFTFDALGSVRGVTEDSGAVVANYDYDTYGNQTNLAGTLVADFGFAGYYKEPNSGLYLTVYRAYDPDSGRWLNRDPIAEAGGMNLYGYVGNNPVNGLDPMGLVDWPSIGQHLTDINDLNDALLSTPAAPEVQEAEAAVTEAAAEVAAAAEVVVAAVEEGGKAIEAGTDAFKSYEEAAQAAEKLYPKKCGKFENHHHKPTYLGGDPDGPLVRLPAPYHQLITNAFRREYGYGQPIPQITTVENIVNRVYSKLPLPK